MNMKLTIIIPIYNCEQYLRECVQSLIHNYVDGTEIILIDDGSTDHSANICDTYAQQYDFIKVFHIENQGVSNARNVGIREATGEYVCFVDADDYLLDNGIQIILREISRYDAEIILFPYVSEKKDSSSEHFFYSISNKQVSGEKALMIYLHEGGAAAWAKVYKRAMLLHHHIQFKVSMKMGEDSLFCTQAIGASEQAAFSDQAFYFYRYNDAGASKKHKAEYFEDYWSLYQVQINYLERFGNNSDIEFLDETFLKRIITTS